MGHKNLVFIQMKKCEIHIFYTYFSKKGQNSTILAFLGGDLVEEFGRRLNRDNYTLEADLSAASRAALNALSLWLA